MNLLSVFCKGGTIRQPLSRRKTEEPNETLGISVQTKGDGSSVRDRVTGEGAVEMDPGT